MFNLTLDNFDKTILTSNSDKVKIVQFSANWCSSCQEFQSTLEQLKTIYSDNLIEFYKVDIDQCPDLAEKYDINKVPTFLFFKNYNLVNFIIGNEPIERFNRLLNHILND